MAAARALLRTTTALGAGPSGSASASPGRPPAAWPTSPPPPPPPLTAVAGAREGSTSRRSCCGRTWLPGLAAAARGWKAPARLSRCRAGTRWCAWLANLLRVWTLVGTPFEGRMECARRRAVYYETILWHLTRHGKLNYSGCSRLQVACHNDVKCTASGSLRLQADSAFHTGTASGALPVAHGAD